MQNFDEWGEIGAGLSVWEKGEEVLGLAGGVTERGGSVAWKDDTLMPIYSAGKGVAAATLAMVMKEEGGDEEWEVRRIWPEFAGGGKGALTLREVLSHQAGIAALDEQVDIADHGACVGAIEKQTPNWRLGQGLHGYHARTFGTVLEELVRRMCGGRTLGEMWRTLAGEPMGIDVWFGVPDSEMGRIGRLSGPREMLEEEFTRAYLDRNSLTRRAFESPGGFQRIEAMNGIEGWELGNAAMGGVASAGGLAKFYGLLASGALCPSGVELMRRGVVAGDDLVLREKTAFSFGMMMRPAGVGSFGHPGAGGSLGLCDLSKSLGFGYVMNQMAAGALPGGRPTALAHAVFAN
ncbi:MAG: serine hydrolase [Verrucomicrobiales bacterium]|nr:serine hydrolase [Verrucomicrobiales bacterium]